MQSSGKTINCVSLGTRAQISNIAWTFFCGLPIATDGVAATTL